MKMTIDMPVVKACSISECGYNRANKCHARAITIGGGTHPGCDTSYLGAPVRTTGNNTAGVGACKITGCTFNDDLECNSSNITVSMKNDSIQCMTFQVR
ncbi:MAG: DUF1540 domain-containing protein [Gammaproteobacteria bacterium]|nr:DUF1540 domain-containing protein [Gammaproteobacteria bacterium]